MAKNAAKKRTHGRAMILEYIRKRRAKAQRERRCVNCGAPAYRSYFCRQHWTANQARRFERHPLACRECGTLLSDEHRAQRRHIHPDCVEDRRKRLAREHARTHRAAINAMVRRTGSHRRSAVVYQERHRAAGLCLKCPEPVATATSAFCWGHLQKNRESLRKWRGCKPWKPGGRGRPPKEIAR